jgi:thioredoxin reductase
MGDKNNSSNILIEAESFEDFGGWKMDSQFIDLMGSPYLIAHGHGNPVAPATTTVTLPDTGRWFIWVRTKNWVDGDFEAPGRFKLAVNESELPEIFGTQSAEWGWENGGVIDIEKAKLKISLIDLTGFDGRCDAILFTQDESLVPDNSSEPMCEWRRNYGNVVDDLEEQFDLVVVGGGIAGTSTAVSAVRAGLSVALIENRPVLGGNASAEIHVKPSGNFPPGRFPYLGDIVREVAPRIPGKDSNESFLEAEALRLRVVEEEEGIELFLDHHVYEVETENEKINAVWALSTDGKQRRRFSSRYFVDATGHGTVGLKAGADIQMEAGERMGMTNNWWWHMVDKESPFPETPWALQLTEKGFPYTMRAGGIGHGGFGFPESGFDKHPLRDLEAIRDHNLRAVYGAMHAMKNKGAYASEDPSGKSHAHAEIKQFGHIGGPRETLQILGDVIVTDEDIYSKKEFKDGCVPATWGVDLHFPMFKYLAANPDNPFVSRAHFDGRVDDSKGIYANSDKTCVIGPMHGKYDVKKGYLFPYRSFYSRNIKNLFTAGRDISVSHEALGTVRVMNTLGMVGVVVGRAAAMACKYDETPSGVYENHWDEFKELLEEPGDFRAISKTGILIEAESFDDLGGWKIDTQFIHSMGSPYLIAHGLGKPVAPAHTSLKLPQTGLWYLWVRTKNWVKGNFDAPGRFKLGLNGKELPYIYGEGEPEWNWECGGTIDVENNDIQLSLIDLTGFNGRCDAIFLCRDEDTLPEPAFWPMSDWRICEGAIQEYRPETYDLVVIGGGIAGTAAAIAAARTGLEVALINNRPELGGNGSTEVRVAFGGKFPDGLYPNLGDIVKEITLQGIHNAVSIAEFGEAENNRQKIIAAESTLSLFNNQHVFRVVNDDNRISEVFAMDTHSKFIRRYKAKYFVDATGHGTVGVKAGADYEMQAKERMGTSNLWTWSEDEKEIEFPETPWALPLTEKGFPYPKNVGDWYWESGFDKHPLDDLESIRDHNLRAVFGAWNAMKNHGVYASEDKSEKSHSTANLDWVAYIGGPRETLQLMGDVVVSEEHILTNQDFPDACVPATWGIDLHYPMPNFKTESSDNPFISRAHFGSRVDDSKGKWFDSPRHCIRSPEMKEYDTVKGYLFPYRAFYSRNIENLFMAGRDISVTHEALGTVRVQNTLGMVGVVVGRAASVACKNDTTPRGVYEDHLEELKSLLLQPGDYRGL